MDLSKLDKVFSEYIRRRDADDYGRVKCCTCSTVSHWAEMDCGHFIPRTHLSTRFDEMNCHSQCKTCNQIMTGEMPKHGLYITQRYSIDAVSKLIAKSRKATHFMQHEIDELVELYKQKIKEL